MATRAMYLTVKKDADTKYYSLVQAVYDYLSTDSASKTITVSHNGGEPTAIGGPILKTWIDEFFTNKRGANITTKGETTSTYASTVLTSETIKLTINAGSSNSPMSSYFSSYIATVSTFVSPYVCFKIASMTDADYTAFIEKFRANIKAGYPTDRVWNETNSPEA